MEDLFTVAWWEQRGAGLSYRRKIPRDSLTTQQLIADTLAVTDYLRRRFRTATDVAETVPVINVPAYLVHGTYDYTISYVQAKVYFDRLQAPLKGFFTFEESAHSPMFEQPEQLLRIMHNNVLAGAVSLADRRKSARPQDVRRGDWTHQRGADPRQLECHPGFNALNAPAPVPGRQSITCRPAKDVSGNNVSDVMWSDGVIPVAVERRRFELDGCQFSVWNLRVAVPRYDSRHHAGPQSRSAPYQARARPPLT